jgi:hypothetical protein
VFPKFSVALKSVLGFATAIWLGLRIVCDNT